MSGAPKSFDEMVVAAEMPSTLVRTLQIGNECSYSDRVPSSCLDADLQRRCDGAEAWRLNYPKVVAHLIDYCFRLAKPSS
jgi:hypothetical protein